MAASLLARLDARDRALYARWALPELPRWSTRARWLAITHLGGTTVSVGAAALPMLAGGRTAAAAREAFLILALSHGLVQLVKRSVGRPRPAVRHGGTAHVAAPDHFSFPSGHAAAAMAVALGYALAFPWLGAILLPLALVVGFSRVVLGVHYPGDVLTGQLLAIGTAALLRILG